MRRFLVTALALLLLAPPAYAADKPDQGACFERVSKDFKAINAEYRSVLLGSRRDKDGKFAVLTGGFTDKLRVGIFETKGRESSELIDPALQSFRVYRCKMTSVCEAMSRSFGSDDKAPFPVQPLGCEEVQLSRYPECYFGGTDPNTTTEADASDQLSVLDMVTACTQFVDDSVQSEAAVLRLIVGYDAGYRSLLQFAGMMDWMMEGFPEQTIRAIADMVNLLGKLHQIPCYIGQCDLPSTESL